VRILLEIVRFIVDILCKDSHMVDDFTASDNIFEINTYVQLEFRLLIRCILIWMSEELPEMLFYKYCRLLKN